MKLSSQEGGTFFWDTVYKWFSSSRFMFP